MLYQLSYSRANNRSRLTACHGGEGNRTPDLLNAIQALSQLSYTPGVSPDDHALARQEPRRISKGSIDVKKFAMAKKPTAGILQRFDNQKFFDYSNALLVMRRGCRDNTNPLALLACYRLHSHRLSQQYLRGVHQWLK